MKKNLTLVIVIMLFSVIAFSQITLDSAMVPFPTDTFHLYGYTTFTPNPLVGTNQTWNYSSYVPNDSTYIAYAAETDTFFTNHGIEANEYTDKNLNATSYYDLYEELDFNSSGVFGTGIHIPAQGYSLTAITGGPNDSLKFADQTYRLTSSRTHMSFPMTINSAWHSTSYRTGNFRITVVADALNNAPMEQTYNLVSNDTIVGWGKMSVHTSNGPSIQYDVLMDKASSWAIDSFYLYGTPAPTQLLTAFSVTQGQQSGLEYSYLFYRPGYYTYLARFNYGTDSSYTTPASQYFAKDNTSTGIGEINGIQYSSLVFPNPINGSEINVKIFGKTFVLTQYQVVDLLGRTIQQGNLSMQTGDLVKISLNTTIENGCYFLKVINKNNQEIVTEKIQIQR